MFRLIVFFICLFLREGIVAAESPAGAPSALTAPLPKANSVQRNEEAEDFYPHLTQSARTAGPWKVRYQPYPGADPTSQLFLANTLSVGIGSAFEIGTIPIYYLNSSPDLKITNATAKANLLESRQVDLGFGTSVIRYQFNFGDPAIQAVDSFQFSLMVNYRFIPAYQLGVNVNSGLFHIEGERFADFQQSNVLIKPDLFADLSMRLRPHLFVTPGISFSHLAYSMFRRGAGCSVTWERPGKFFSSPSIGLHVLKGQTYEANFLASTSFF